MRDVQTYLSFFGHVSLCFLYEMIVSSLLDYGCMWECAIITANSNYILSTAPIEGDRGRTLRAKLENEKQQINGKCALLCASMFVCMAVHAILKKILMLSVFVCIGARSRLGRESDNAKLASCVVVQKFYTYWISAFRFP